MAVVGRAEHGVERSAEQSAEPQASAHAGSSAARQRRRDPFYQTRDVVEILGISRRQLQYWAKTNLVEPTAKTPGGHRRYSFEDLVALKAAKRLIDAGVSVQRIRTSIQSLRTTLPAVERPLSELVLVATGDIVLVFRDGAAFEAVSGQEWVFEVAEFQREVNAWSAASKTNTGSSASSSVDRPAGTRARKSVARERETKA